MWPMEVAIPERASKWLGEVGPWTQRLPELRARLERMRAEALPWNESERELDARDHPE